MANSEGNEGEKNPSRYPRNLDGLLKMSIEQSSGQEATGSVFSEMSEERKNWLSDALSSIAGDTDVKKMKTCLLVLDKTDSNEADEDVLTEKESAFEELEMLVETIDNANDFQKIGGFTVIVKYLQSNHSSLRWRAANHLAECMQNNPYCQNAAMEFNMVPTLLQLLDSDPSEQVKIKSLYALSCLTRDFPDAEKVFLGNDGFSVLIRAMQGNVEKLKIKSTFLMKHLITTNSSHKESLFKMGVVEQLVALISGPQEIFHEHALSVLVCLVEDSPEIVQECRRTEFDLEAILKKKVSALTKEDKEKYKEEIAYCDELLKVCFGEQARTDNADSCR